MFFLLYIYLNISWNQVEKEPKRVEKELVEKEPVKCYICVSHRLALRGIPNIFDISEQFEF